MIFTSKSFRRLFSHTIHFSGVLIGCGLALSASETLAQSSQNVAPRAQGQSLETIEAERKKLFDRMMARPDDLDTAFQYAALSSQAGDLEGAVSTLERMLIYAPGLPRLQLELGVLYYRLGAYETARQYFEGAQAAGNVPPEVEAKVEEYLAAIDKRAAPTSLTGMVRAGIRYQSNANAGPSNSTVTLNGLSYTLDNLTVAGEDFNAFLTSSVRYRHELDEQGIAIEAGLSGYTAGYRDRDTLNTGALEGFIGPTFDLARFGLDDRTLSVFLLSSGVLIEGDRYLASIGASTVFNWQVTPTDDFGAQVEYRYEDYNNTKSRLTAENQTGDRIDGQLSYSRQVTEDFNLSARLLATRRSAEEDYLSSTELGLGIGSALRFASPVGDGPAWVLALDTAVARRNYDGPDAMINADESQQDTEFSINLRQIVPFNDRVALVAEAGYRKVWSNYDIKTFDNISVSLGIQTSF
jgi:tetratricopeptide (TPR) repeat protein